MPRRSRAELKQRIRAAARRIQAKNDSAYEPKRLYEHATVTGLTRDTAQRIVGVTANINGISSPVSIDIGMPVAEGDVLEVQNLGSKTLPHWRYTRKIQSVQAIPNVDPTPTLPTPTGLSLTTGFHTPPTGGTLFAWVYARWQTIQDYFGLMAYDVQYWTNDDLDDPTVIQVVDMMPHSYLAVAVNSSWTNIPRDPATNSFEFPRNGRIQIELELIDYTTVTEGNGSSGTGTGSTNLWTDSGASWEPGGWINYLLSTGSGEEQFLITDNDATTLTVSGTPTSGAYEIHPCFSGCTRGAGGTSAVAHAIDIGISRRSCGINISGLLPDTDYNFRVRAIRMANVVSAWTSVVSIQTDVDDVAPGVPTGLAAQDGPGLITLTWTGPILDTCPDLAGFEVYEATDGSGTGATKVQDVGLVYQTRVPLLFGWTRWYNLKAYDTSGNVSGYGSTWQQATSYLYEGMQMVANADWERNKNGTTRPDKWEYTVLQGTPTSTIGAYGRDGTQGWRFALDDEEEFFFYFPKQSFTWDILAEVGFRYTSSIFYNTTVSDANIDHSWDSPDGKLCINISPCFHNGVGTVTAAQDPDASVTSYPYSNDWRRLVNDHVVTSSDITGGKVYIGFWCNVYNRSGGSVTVDFDRPQLELGYASEWKPGVVPGGASGNAPGLLIDGAGIITGDGAFWLGDDGSIYSDLTFDDSSEYHIKGSTAVWARVYRASTQSIGDSSWTPVSFGVEHWDTDAIHSNTVNPTRLTATTAGIYMITGHVEFDGNSTGRRAMRIVHGGSTVMAITRNLAPSASINCELNLSTLYYLAEDEYVELEVYQNSGGNLNVVVNNNYSPEFAMARVA